MSLFKKKSSAKSYDKDTQKPVIKASICNGEQVAGFKDLHTGKFEEVMLICSAAFLDDFSVMYGITEEITNEYSFTKRWNYHWAKHQKNGSKKSVS